MRSFLAFLRSPPSSSYGTFLLSLTRILRPRVTSHERRLLRASGRQAPERACPLRRAVRRDEPYLHDAVVGPRIAEHLDAAEQPAHVPDQHAREPPLVVPPARRPRPRPSCRAQTGSSCRCRHTPARPSLRFIRRLAPLIISASKPVPAITAKCSPFTVPVSNSRGSPCRPTRTAPLRSSGMFRLVASRFAVPAGRIASTACRPCDRVDAALHHAVAAPDENELGALCHRPARIRRCLLALVDLVPQRLSKALAWPEPRAVRAGRRPCSCARAPPRRPLTSHRLLACRPPHAGRSSLSRPGRFPQWPGLITTGPITTGPITTGPHHDRAPSRQGPITTAPHHDSAPSLRGPNHDTVLCESLSPGELAPMSVRSHLPRHGSHRRHPRDGHTHSGHTHNPRLGGSLTPLALLTSAAIVFTVLLVLVRLRWQPLEAVDHGAADRLNNLISGHPTALTVISDVTLLGSTLVLSILIAAASLLLALRRRWRLAAYLVATGAGALVLDPVLKVLVGRLRPVVAHPVAHAPGNSFPSGHSLGSIVCYGALFLVFLPAAKRAVAHLVRDRDRGAGRDDRDQPDPARRALHLRRHWRLGDRDRLARPHDVRVRADQARGGPSGQPSGRRGPRTRGGARTCSQRSKSHDVPGWAGSRQGFWSPGSSSSAPSSASAN